MTKYELLKTCASVCDILNKNGMSAADVKYVGMMADYIRMTQEGQKTSWVVFYLAQQYGVGEATVYRITKKLAESCDI